MDNLKKLIGDLVNDRRSERGLNTLFPHPLPMDWAQAHARAVLDRILENGTLNLPTRMLYTEPWFLGNQKEIVTTGHPCRNEHPEDYVMYLFRDRFRNRDAQAIILDPQLRAMQGIGICIQEVRKQGDKLLRSQSGERNLYTLVMRFL